MDIFFGHKGWELKIGSTSVSVTICDANMVIMSNPSFSLFFKVLFSFLQNCEDDFKCKEDYYSEKNNSIL